MLSKTWYIFTITRIDTYQLKYLKKDSPFEHIKIIVLPSIINKDLLYINRV